MSITVASVLNAKGKRSEVAKLLGKSKQTLNCWVTKGSIPAKFAVVLVGGKAIDESPDLRKLFGFVGQ